MDEEFSCNRCGYTSFRKDYMIKHLSRQTQCDPVIKDVDVSIQRRSLQKYNRERPNFNPVTGTYNCNYCNREFKTSGGKHVHAKKCKEEHEAKAAKAAVLQAELEKDSKDDKMQKALLDLEEHQKALQEQINLLRQAQHITTNNNTTNNTINNNNTFNINISNFGAEPLTMSDEFMQHCLYLCQDDENLETGVQNGITTLIKELHSPPENQNVRIKNLNQSLLLIYKDGEWHLESKNNVLEALFHKGKTIMSKYKAANKPRLYDHGRFEGIFEEIEEWLSNFDDEHAPKARDRKIIIKQELLRNIIAVDNKRKTTLLNQ